MGEQNVVTFNTCLDVHNQRYVLDFLNTISVENSMAFLPFTVHDMCVTQEEYIEYLYHYVSDEMDYLIKSVAESDPKLWKRTVESLKEQIKVSKNLIRFVITISEMNQEGILQTELHELVVMWDSESNSYVLLNYILDHDSLIAIATQDFLYPEIPGLEPPPAVIRIS